MGGRGGSAVRLSGSILERDSSRLSVRATAGGGGAITSPTAGDAPDLSTYDVVSFSYKSGKGSMTIRDANGRLHKSSQVQSGSTRTTYVFDNFVLKFEGLKKAGFPGQNEADARAYKGIAEKNRRYFTKLLTENRGIVLKVNGVDRKLQVIAAERAIPVKPPSNQTERLLKSFYKARANAGGKSPISDVSLETYTWRDSGIGHNVYVVKTKSGRYSIKIFDYAFQDIKPKYY